MLRKTKKERENPKRQRWHLEMSGTQAISGFYVNDRELLVMYSVIDETE